MAQKFGLRWHRDCNNRQSFGKGRFWKAFIRNQAKNNYRRQGCELVILDNWFRYNVGNP